VRGAGWNPLNTLTGRLVLVTVAAVAISYAAAFALFANERGAALRRAAETAVIERVAYTAARLREAQPGERAFLADNTRDFSIHYSVSRAPELMQSAPGAGARVARAIAEQLGDAEVRGEARTVERPSRRWRIRRGPGRRFDDRDPPPDTPMIRVTEVSLSVQLGAGSWLNARARLPGPRPAPLSVLAGALVSVLAVGIGAALVSRQIGRPLADLATPMLDAPVLR
jgi:hypothetical protein